MKVYVVFGNYHWYFGDDDEFCESSQDLLEVFVREQDAKKFVAGHNRARCSLNPDDYPPGCPVPNIETDTHGNFYDDFDIRPRTLRTGWPQHVPEWVEG